MGPPVSVTSLPTGTFESGVINPILNWSDMSNLGGMQATSLSMRVPQQPTPRLGFSNQSSFGGGFEPGWDAQGSGTWDDSGVFIGTNIGMGGTGIGVPDMSMGGMAQAMGMQAHGMGGTNVAVGMGMGQNMNSMGHMNTGLSIQNPVAMSGMTGMTGMNGMGRGNIRGMAGMGSVGMNNMNNLGMSGMGNMGGMGMNTMGMGGMNMGHWGSS